MFILSHYEKAPITIHEMDVWWYSVYNHRRYRGFNHTKATLSVGECWYPGELVQLSILFGATAETGKWLPGFRHPTCGGPSLDLTH